MSNGKIDELKLMAYVDGELEAEDAREVETFLETSEEAREIVAKLQGSGDLLKETYVPVLSAPAPQRMVETIKGRARPTNVVKLSRLSMPKSWMGMAASVAMGVIVGVGGMQGYYSSSGENTPAQEPSFKVRGGSSSVPESVDLRDEFSQDLKNVLEGTEAGQEIAITLESGAVVVFTPGEISQSTSGSLCRTASYKILTSSSSSNQDVQLTACRGEDGTWRAIKVE